ncbi:odorant receptor 131-2-like [Festucalex cinctus]
METLANVTTTRLALLDRVAAGTLITSFCLMCLFVNGFMLFTLRSKCVFRETSRYILLYNLLLGDTLQLVVSQLLYLLTACRIRLTYPACGVLTLFSNLVSRLSPLVLVLMSLERFVAVCHPLRHASIITVRTTVGATLAAWLFCFLNVLILGLLLMSPFDQLKSLQMTQLCRLNAMFLVPIPVLYLNVYTYFLFTSASLTIIFSYIGVVVSTRSAATGKDSARKARNTLLLHLVQLSLTLFSVFYHNIMSLLLPFLSRLILARAHVIFYVCFFMLPRSLSSLAYGLRDQKLRVVLRYHLCCHLKVSVAAVKDAVLS